MFRQNSEIICGPGAHGHAHVERRRVAARAAHVAGAAAAAAARAARPAAPPRPLLPLPARALPQRHAAEGEHTLHQRTKTQPLCHAFVLDHVL